MVPLSVRNMIQTRLTTSPVELIRTSGGALIGAVGVTTRIARNAEISNTMTFKYVTPWEFVKGLPEYPFDLDVAAEKRNAKAKEYFTETDDGLKRLWRGKVWCNPPYSNPGVWIRKAIEEKQHCEVIVMLLKSDTGTKWFHDLLRPNADVTFLRDRIRFNGERAPWPCLLARFT